MKKYASIKTRITIWYTSLMFVLISVVLALAGTLTYQLSIDGIENEITLQVTEVSEEISRRHLNVFNSVESDKAFKNVSIYDYQGNHITGQYIYDIANLEFKQGRPRMETVDGKEYIVYDVFKRGMPGGPGGLWIRGAETVNLTVFWGKSAVIAILIIIPLMLLFAVLGGYYITKKAFLPVNNIIKTANEISSEKDVTRRIPIVKDSKQDELHKLSLTLNNMLDRIESLINQEKQFTSDASHELRTPVSVILAQGEYLFDIADTDKEKELARIVVDKAHQVSRLISQLLLLARIDQNRQKFVTEKIDLGLLIDIAIENLKAIAEEKQILLISNVPDGSFVEGDEALLLSVVTNLISNAVKYGKQNGHVCVSVSDLGNYTEILVADNGVGIPEDKIDKIWKRFYRIDDVRNDEYGSCGLGLSVVKSIVGLHGGEISVRSKEGEGSEFRIILKKI